VLAQVQLELFTLQLKLEDGEVCQRRSQGVLGISQGEAGVHLNPRPPPRL
jgi:hypothetical protein